MPISDCEVRDPRMRRTRQLLQGALTQLMQTKSFDEISVQDITDTATVNRATFYDHYTDKFALLAAFVGGGFHQMLHERAVRFDGNCPAAAASVILATCDYLTQVHATQGTCERQSAFEPLMDAAVAAAIRRVLTEGLAKHIDPTPELREMRAAAASWAIYGAVKQWFQTSNRVPADAIVPEIVRMVTPLLTSPVGAPHAGTLTTH